MSNGQQQTQWDKLCKTLDDDSQKDGCTEKKSSTKGLPVNKRVRIRF